MNKISKALLVAALCSLPLMAAPSETAVKVTAPFAFVAGDVALPAGQYEIATDQLTGVVTLRSADGKITRSLGATSSIETYGKNVEPRLEFRKLGSVMSLEKVYMNSAAVELPAPSVEGLQAPALTDTDD